MTPKYQTTEVLHLLLLDLTLYAEQMIAPNLVDGKEHEAIQRLCHAFLD